MVSGRARLLRAVQDSLRTLLALLDREHAGADSGSLLDVLHALASISQRSVLREVHIEGLRDVPQGLQELAGSCMVADDE